MFRLLNLPIWLAILAVFVSLLFIILWKLYFVKLWNKNEYKLEGMENKSENSCNSLSDNTEYDADIESNPDSEDNSDSIWLECVNDQPKDHHSDKNQETSESDTDIPNFSADFENETLDVEDMIITDDEPIFGDLRLYYNALNLTAKNLSETSVECDEDPQSFFKEDENNVANNLSIENGLTRGENKPISSENSIDSFNSLHENEIWFPLESCYEWLEFVKYCSSDLLTDFKEGTFDFENKAPDTPDLMFFGDGQIFEDLMLNFNANNPVAKKRGETLLDKNSQLVVKVNKETVVNDLIVENDFALNQNKPKGDSSYEVTEVESCFELKNCREWIEFLDYWPADLFSNNNKDNFDFETSRFKSKEPDVRDFMICGDGPIFGDDGDLVQRYGAFNPGANSCNKPLLMSDERPLSVLKENVAKVDNDLSAEKSLPVDNYEPNLRKIGKNLCNKDEQTAVLLDDSKVNNRFKPFGSSGFRRVRRVLTNSSTNAFHRMMRWGK